MFGRCCFSIALLLLIVFASSSNAIQYKECRKYQIKENGDLKGVEATTKQCVGCSGYICKTPDGNFVRGGDCTDKVDDICKQGWSMVKIGSIARERIYQAEKGKYFVFSCQEDNCNDINWLKDRMIEYKNAIKSVGLSVQKSDENTECIFFNGEVVDCDSVPLPSSCDTDKDRLNKMSNGRACISGNFFIDAKQVMICQNGVCKCLEKNDRKEDVEAPCDNKMKFFVFECDTMTDAQKANFNKASQKERCPLSSTGNGNGADKKGADNNGAADKKGDNGAETIGYGFTLLMAPLFASLFL